jgi:hypothetical protein
VAHRLSSLSMHWGSASEISNVIFFLMWRGHLCLPRLVPVLVASLSPLMQTVELLVDLFYVILLLLRSPRAREVPAP